MLRSASKILRPFLSVLCVFLMVNNLALVPSVRAEIPDRYTWQVERVEETGTAWAMNGFEGGDVALVWEDIPAQMFPLELWEVLVWWQAPPGYCDHHLAARVLLYEGATGELRYVLEHVALMPGFNRIRLRVECSDCRALFAADDGPGLGIGIHYVTEFEHPVWSGSGHIVTDDEGCWSGTNMVYDDASATWLDPCTYGMSGNFGLRAVYEPLCPDRLGDIDGDMHVDVSDFGTLQAAFTGSGGDVFGDPRVYADLNNDYAVDCADFDLMTGDFTGPANEVTCPDPAGPPAPKRGCSYLRPFGDPSQFPDIPRALYRVPSELNDDPGRWTYTQVAVILGILVVLTAIIGPCVSTTCREAGRVDFATGVPHVDGYEADRIRLAIDRIGQLPGQLSEDCYFYLAQPGWYNPEKFGLIRINRSAGEDDMAYGAAHVLGRITIHQSFFDGDRWDRYGVDGLALLLFAEWLHYSNPGWDEHQCQEQLMQWRQQVGFEEVAPEFGHGFGD